MSGIRLYDYQNESIGAIEAAHASGIQRPAVVLPTGSGKSVIIGGYARQMRQQGGRRIVVAAHREELVEQNAQKISDVLRGTSARVGVVMAGRNQTMADIVSASIATIRNPQRRRQLGEVSDLIIDECFPAGTLVGTAPIETLKPGDLVPSWDELSGTVVQRPVVALMRRVPHSVVRVTFTDGTDLVCTANHPILTAGGWQAAGRLLRGVDVVSFTHDATATGDMYGVRKLLRADQESEDRCVASVRSDLLPGFVSRRMGVPRRGAAYGSDERALRFRADGGTEPDAQARNANQDGRYAAEDSASAAYQGRQRDRRAASSATVGRTSRLANGGDRRAGGWRSTLSLQTGHCPPNDDGMRRSGRGIPLLAGAPRIRSTSGFSPRFTRVADVQILEPGSDGTYSGLCSGGVVYNIEVAGTHTYLVGDGVVAHNCHHGAADSYVDTLEYFGCFDPTRGTRALGFTATMSRSDDRSLGEVWQEVVYTKSTAWMIRHGYLVRPRARFIKVADLDFSRVKHTTGDYNGKQLDEAIDDSMAPAAIVRAYIEHGENRPAVAFLPGVASGHSVCDAFNEAGIPAAMIHAKTPKAERRQILADARARKIRVLVNCMVLTEGTDIPHLSCCIVGRPTKSSALFIQMIGRVLRIDRDDPTKVDALVLIVAAKALGHTLNTPVELFGAELEMIDDPDERQELIDEAADVELIDEEEITLGTILADEPSSGRDGPLISEEVDLFASSHSAWMQTDAGIWFLPTGERYVALLPGRAPGTWDVVAMARHVRGPGSWRWVVRDVSRRDYAMAWAEGDVTPAEAVIARKDRPWRAARPSPGMLANARRYRLPVSDGMLGGEVSQMITTAEATARIDPYLGERVQRQLVGV